jgi:hypothetical protein
MARTFQTVSWSPSLTCLLLLVGCVTTQQGKRDLLDFMVDGKTACVDLTVHLGPPTGLFESGRIQTFHIDEDSHGYKVFGMDMATRKHLQAMETKGVLVRPTGWEMSRYSLVAECDSAGVLSRHTLVPVKNAQGGGQNGTTH